MKLLAWDTSSKAGVMAALEWDPSDRTGWSGVRLCGEWTLDVAATHSERLLWGIHQLLESARWKLHLVDVFAVGVGPGSFTGLRIGLTTARTLAHTLRKPLIGVSSLAALARPAAIWLSGMPHSGAGNGLGGTLLIAATDACKGELFTLMGSARALLDCVSLADGDCAGLWKRGVLEEVLTAEELAAEAKRRLNRVSTASRAAKKVGWMALGEGRLRYPELWKHLPASREILLPDPLGHQIQGRYLAQLAWEACQAGLMRNALDVHPRYLRASDAELKLKAGLLPPQGSRGSMA